MLKLGANYLLRRGGGRNPELLRAHGRIQCATGGTLCPRASAAVCAEVERLVDEGLLATGLQVAAHAGGRPLLSVWGGLCGSSFPKASKINAGAALPVLVTESSLFMAYSVAKGVASTAMCLTMAKGGVSFDDPVTAVWPSFAASSAGASASVDARSVAATGRRQGGQPRRRHA